MLLLYYRIDETTRGGTARTRSQPGPASVDILLGRRKILWYNISHRRSVITLKIFPFPSAWWSCSRRRRRGVTTIMNACEPARPVGTSSRRFGTTSLDLRVNKFYFRCRGRHQVLLFFFPHSVARAATKPHIVCVHYIQCVSAFLQGEGRRIKKIQIKYVLNCPRKSGGDGAPVINYSFIWNRFFYFLYLFRISCFSSSRFFGLVVILF